ncbi:response regulator [Paracoccus aeridis]|uniref:response regulator n=1 Tax=Paracoccus aeridis TaxID=1966466 RepID=UPI001375F638|nr:response regulator [Paracoccus aeridis]
MTVATHALAPLQDRSIMVVEDEFFQAKDLTQAFSAAGARLVGPFPSLSAAVDALEDAPPIDAAVLDINLRGRSVYELADLLAGRGIPFLFATGYDPEMVPERHGNRPICTKPFRIENLLVAVADLCAGPSAEGHQQRVREPS